MDLSLDRINQFICTFGFNNMHMVNKLLALDLRSKKQYTQGQIQYKTLKYSVVKVHCKTK